MKLRKTTIIFWIVAVLPLILASIALPFVGESLPTGYNFNGEVTTWGSAFTLLTLPIIAGVVSAVTFVCLYILNRMCEVKIKQRLLDTACFVMVGIMDVVAFAVMAVTILKR